MPIGVIITITAYSTIVVTSFIYGLLQKTEKVTLYNKDWGEFSSAKFESAKSLLEKPPIEEPNVNYPKSPKYKILYKEW